LSSLDSVSNRCEIPLHLAGRWGFETTALYLTVFIIFVSSVGLTEMVSADTANDKAKKIDASADEALDRFYKQVKGAKFTKLDMSK
jgi:hypothetical protein